MKSKNKYNNPFPTTGYLGPKYFCDRDDELKKILSAVRNDRPITLFSKRRMGKTGLIKHLHHHLDKSGDYINVYVDVYNTMRDEELVAKLVNATVKALENTKKSFVTDLLNVFGKYSPKITIDPITGVPGIELNIQTKSDVGMSLNTLFTLLESQKKRIQISIDEFQQISNYKESCIAATFREHMQSSNNVHFLFCGSQRHLLHDLFNNPAQPLYRMVDQMFLNEIPAEIYKSFIIDHFSSSNRIIGEEVVDELLAWTRSHTFYVQVVCNKLYSMANKKIELKDLLEVKTNIKKELEMNFLVYKQLLSKNQYQVLLGIAKEGMVKSVRSKKFSNKYKVAPSTANQSLKYLLESELVYEELTINGSEYNVYDVFLERWLSEENIG